MTQQELEAALRREGERKTEVIWQTAEAEAEQLRRATAQRIENLRQAEAARRQRQISAGHEAELSAARRQAQSCRLRAEAKLAERLRSLAHRLLPELATAGGERLFRALAAELPAYPWRRIKVNPRDTDLAAGTFAGAEILTSAGLSAGLEVESADARIRIINSLEKRLEHLWPVLLPELLKELRPPAGDDETLS